MTTPFFSCPFQERASLASTGYYAIGGEARWLVQPRSVGELAAAIERCRRLSLPVIVAGKGSNMLFSDDGFPGAVISLDAMNRMFRVSETFFFCEAGVENSAVAVMLRQAGRCGGEWLYRLPGTIGATVRMNGRCYGREISAVTKSVVTVALDGTVRWRTNDEVFLGYKQTSLMRSPEIVVGAILAFPDEDTTEAIDTRMQSFGDDRDSKHQFDYPSCGSVFKNSYQAGKPSGQIFDALGFRGRREGGAQVSLHHANFIFNTGGAKAVDVLRLAAAMRTEALEKTGAELELELQCAGLFESSLLDAAGVVSTPDPSRPGYAWTGLLRFSDDHAGAFPRVVLEGPMTDYGCRDGGFPPGIAVRVEQLDSVAEAVVNPEKAFLRWTTVDISGAVFSRFPDAPQGSFVDRLWEESVSELFISNGRGKESAYLEFEMTPAGHWLALGFQSVRRRAPEHEIPSNEFWRGKLYPFTQGNEFGMELSFALVEPFICDGHLSVQCCASPGDGRYGLFPWWYGDGKPDFHQPDRFCPLRLV